MKVTRKVHGELMAARKARTAQRRKSIDELRREAGREGSALQRFMATVGEIQLTLAAIREAADNHFDTDPGDVTWGHVGDANRTLAGLKEILAVIRGEGR
jgi:hypothetical protein